MKRKFDSWLDRGGKDRNSGKEDAEILSGCWERGDVGKRVRREGRFEGEGGQVSWEDEASKMPHRGVEPRAGADGRDQM